MWALTPTLMAEPAPLRLALMRKIKSVLFKLAARNAGSRLYAPHKVSELRRLLELPFDPDNVPHGFGYKLDERLVEYPWLFSRLPETPGELLDAGSVLNHDFILSHPGLKSKKITIITLAPEGHSFWNLGINYVYGDLRQTYFRGDYFDFIVCVSTLEHIGLDNQRFHPGQLSNLGHAGSHLEAVKEFRRTLKPGGRCYITVPFGKSFRGHWHQVFDGDMIDELVATFRPSWFKETYFRHLPSAGWQTSSRKAASDAVYFDYQVDRLWPGCPAAAEAVVCLELEK
jgi:SAM-dependent methyltransferase